MEQIAIFHSYGITAIYKWLLLDFVITVISAGSALGLGSFSPFEGTMQHKQKG